MAESALEAARDGSFDVPTSERQRNSEAKAAALQEAGARAPCMAALCVYDWR